MIQLQPNAPLIGRLLREQPFNNKNMYRWATFVLNVPYENGNLTYNVLTKELLYFSDNESIETNNLRIILIKKWFLVPSDFCEKDLVEKVKHLFRMIHLRKGQICNYTIFTTTDCNARCSYCFEKDYNRVKMNVDVANKTAQYIKRNCHSHDVRIEWFGGEPLFNMRAIDIICKDLEKKGVIFSSSMKTNGYLFSNRIIEKAKNLWNLKHVQITLDGTENIYNKTKSYIYKDNNPYKRVTENIRLLLSYDINVTIRLNLSLDNSDDIHTIIEQITNDYKSNPHLSIYVHPLFELIGDNKPRKIVFQKLLQLQTLINDSSLGQEYICFSKPRLNHCKADNNCRSVVIFPDGHIGLCDHQWQSDYIGHVDSDKLDGSIIKRWHNYIPPLDRCGSCLLYPDCLKLSLCDTNNHCCDEFIEFDTFRLRNTIIKKYHYYQKHYEIEI